MSPRTLNKLDELIATIVEPYVDDSDTSIRVPISGTRAHMDQSYPVQMEEHVCAPNVLNSAEAARTVVHSGGVGMYWVLELRGGTRWVALGVTQMHRMGKRTC